jgi:hypothetical protein
MYKVIMRLATIDSVATTQTLRDNLQNLGVFAVMVKGNIDKVNVEFDTNYSQLLARGATLDDPIGILFEAYLLVPCYNFTKYISTKHDDYLDGNLTGITHQALMSMAKRKFDFLKTKGKWGAKSPNNEKIVAMTTEITALKGKLKLDPKLSTIAGKGEEKDNAKKSPKKKRNKKDTLNKREQKKDEAWKKEPPKAGESKEGKKVGNIPLIGASTIWRGLSTNPMIATLESSIRMNRRRSPTRPTLPPLPLRPPRPSTPILPPSWPRWPTWT